MRKRKFEDGGVVVTSQRREGSGAQINPKGMTGDEIMELSNKYRLKALKESDNEEYSKNKKISSGLARAAGNADAQESYKKVGYKDKDTNFRKGGLVRSKSKPASKKKR